MVLGTVRRGVTSAVGLAQEAYYHNREKKAQASAVGAEQHLQADHEVSNDNSAPSTLR